MRIRKLMISFIDYSLRTHTLLPLLCDAVRPAKVSEKPGFFRKQKGYWLCAVLLKKTNEESAPIPVISSLVNFGVITSHRPVKRIDALPRRL